MNYKELLKRTALRFQSSPKEIDQEIRAAIKAAGYDMEPELFIALAVSKAREKVKKADK